MVEWKRHRIERPYRAGHAGVRHHGELSATLLRLIREEPLAERTVLDVGCGTGRLAFALAGETGRVIGIDRTREAIERAQQRAGAGGLTHVTFRCLDAEAIDYRDLGPIDLVVANLCMSDEIMRRAAAVLPPDHVIVFAAFHEDQWRESGRRSRFAYAEDELEGALARTGFHPVYLGVEQEVLHFGHPDDGPAYIQAAGLADTWKADSRWEGFRLYLDRGGRRLTATARVIAKARRQG
jgi:SAM-dependent methyltransferase